ncbi:Alpha/Beta hydrolase protein [Apodospora peruviana]|uniref:Alpha/Beta hydrolase protein n=1 Tax=Apodospora peruviana TaxID=516989 RepID=A0AAE0MG23_9PEZI|nr:Alpha/Beta hydrolase protein [Apodospora peruviana]
MATTTDEQGQGKESRKASPSTTLLDKHHDHHDPDPDTQAEMDEAEEETLVLLDSSEKTSRRRRRYVALVGVFASAGGIVALFWVGLWLLVLSGRYSNLPGAGNPVVDLNYTVYEGRRLPNGVDSFLGMRYAAPPLGNLRWRAPAAPHRTGGVEQAAYVRRGISFRPICLGIGRHLPMNDQDEDCLFVNVWAPSDASPRSRLPVWVFIQGGGGKGYQSNANANWNGAGVVEKSGHEIVVVNFNYRVGLWGFLASEHVRQDGNLNAGLLDQRMLLRWVKTNIGSFGGDPDHVVIHGASAGAGSVAMHMVAYGGRNDNLFVGAAAESVFFPAQPFVAEVEWQYSQLLEQTGCDRDPWPGQNRGIRCLRSKSAALLQEMNRAQPFQGRTAWPLPLFYWTPCIDGDLLQDLPYRLFKKGQFVDVPLLSGTANDEGSVFAANAATEADMANFFANNYPALTLNDTDTIIQQYAKLALPPLPRHADWYPATSRAYGEATFTCPNVNILNAMQSHQRQQQPNSTAAKPVKKNNRTKDWKILPNGGRWSQKPLTSSSSSPPVKGIDGSRPPSRLFAYRYNVQDYDNIAAGIGVPHMYDAAAIFGPGNCPSARSYWTYNAPIVPVFMAYWISFVRTLDPNTYRREGSPVWEAWGNSGAEEEVDGDVVVKYPPRRLVVETGHTRMEEVPADQRDKCRFWLDLADVTEQSTGSTG